MRAKQSSAASAIHSRAGTFTLPLPMAILASPVMQTRPRTLRGTADVPGQTGEGVAQGAGLLHDTRNLLGALGLYCDLLSRPNVLKPEHRHYAEELRLVFLRSRSMMERLLASPAQPSGAAGKTPARARPVSLRMIVERCSGLLSQVAEGRTIELNYGPAAAMPVLVDEESVERILLNLVRNAATALDRRPLVEGDRSTHDGAGDDAQGAIRIGVGQLANRVGGPRPFPFERVRLTVEDSGCGMAQKQLEGVLGWGLTSPDTRGIGLRVVRELVSASHGEFSAMSSPGLGTRIQVEWRIAGLSSRGATEEPAACSAGAVWAEEPHRASVRPWPGSRRSTITRPPRVCPIAASMADAVASAVIPCGPVGSGAVGVRVSPC